VKSHKNDHLGQLGIASLGHVIWVILAGDLLCPMASLNDASAAQKGMQTMEIDMMWI
jgi:hypothetical protein